MTKLSDTIYDLVIIGAGPIGLATAIEAKKENLNYTVLEKGVLVNALYNFPEQMTFFSTSKLLEIGGVPFISHIDKPCLLYTSPSPRDATLSRMPSSA